MAQFRDSVRAEMHPFDKNLFRTAARLNASRDVLADLWTELADHAPADGLVWREVAALTATWLLYTTDA
ncbi:hypothetical protein, partial [Acinetobacter baumannii]|uniref:hypothetical protein n=1 Tax=Acinetobacter baumannii TaxID=470 RepID=UPI0020191F3C